MFSLTNSVIEAANYVPDPSEIETYVTETPLICGCYITLHHQAVPYKITDLTTYDCCDV